MPSIMYENTLKHNKIKRRSITCSHIWLINTSKCMYCLDTHSVKVWSRYVLPKTNAVPLCDIIFKQGNIFDLPKQSVTKIKNLATLWKTKTIYHTFSKYLRPLHDALQSECRNYRQTDISYFCRKLVYIWSIWV